MDDEILLITSNIGSLFDDNSILNDEMVKSWIETIYDKINKKKYQFVSIHMQETGGKNPLKSEEIIKFIDYFKPIINEFPYFFYIIDDFVNDKQSYTALSSLYFVKNKKFCKIYDYNEKEFKEFNDESKIIWASNSPETLFFKKKFDKDLFPNQSLSRKGFLSCKFLLNNKSICLTNLHLLHDMDQLETIKNKSPSSYSIFRVKQLSTIVDWLIKSNDTSAILFGDFNFRTNLRCFLENHVGNLIIENEDSTTINLFDNDSKFGSIKSKFIQLDESISSIIFNNFNILAQYDKDLKLCEQDHFSEPSLFSIPSYCYTETFPSTLNRSRGPSWCDRVLFYGDLKRIPIENDIEYNLLGIDRNIGDHKVFNLFIP